ncbi:hypothetical protein TNCV_1495171 [Trichonephila clavipes]|nr:hypothetical protein TNCV_1495171 [Trichonephila clavipes]
MGHKTALSKTHRSQSSEKQFKRWPNQEGSNAHLVGLERNYLLGVAPKWSTTKFGSLLSTIEAFEASVRHEMF